MPFFIVFPCILTAVFVCIFLGSVNAKKASYITTGGVLVALGASCVNFYYTVFGQTKQFFHFFDWINFFGGYTSSWAFYSDSITASMLIVVTFVSSLVHLYSIGYMSHDPHRQRFMAYLSLFTFFMIVLVTSADFLQLFVGWEGVGVSSYLLIGFWFKKDSANNAAMKAFITNRVGDFALIVGLCGIYHLFGTLNYRDVFSQVIKYSEVKFAIAGFSFHYISFICLMLFIGCMGKSAQLGLHVWLPDAMEGPTPVSALIHAATMVTAGVFLIVRCSFLFEYAPLVKNFITIIGALTAIFAATVAITQNDIKKVIAYSTCSQLGYMFFACGLSGYTGAMFHLITHAFFKALLFLSAGSVIHAVSGEQNILKMGGLFKKIPATFVMFMVGSLAIAGIYPFAGFFSKDAILETAFTSHNVFSQFAFIAGILAAALTTLYSWRILNLTFHGKFNGSKHDFDHAHESPIIMLLPLALLAIMAVVSGYVLEHVFSIINHESLFWNGAIFVNAPFHHHHIPLLVKFMPMIIAVFIISLSYPLFLKSKLPAQIADGFKPIYKLWSNKYYFDELYQKIFVKSTFAISQAALKYDKTAIDNIFVGSFMALSLGLSFLLKKVQNGFLNRYIHYMFVFVGAVVLFVLFK